MEKTKARAERANDVTDAADEAILPGVAKSTSLFHPVVGTGVG